MKAWLNSKLVEEKNATISLFDRSYLYGEGIFETLRCYQGKPAFLDRHFRRLQKNGQRLKIALNLSEKELDHALHQLVAANQLKDAVCRITVSLVGASFGVDRPQEAKENITIFCRPVALNPKLFETGVTVWPSATLINDSPATANIKSTSYLIKMLARMEAAEQGCYETLLKNHQGYWVEGSRTNLFIVLDRVVITPPLTDGLLNGITREVVLEILREEDLVHREASISDAMLNNAQEIFLTGSTSEVMPVCEVVGLTKKTIAKTSLTAQLHQAYLRQIFQR